MASSGVRVSAHTAPAIPKTVRMRTKKVLRALASMIRSSRNGFGWASARECSGGAVGSAIVSPGLEGALHLCFRVDEEVGAVDHALALVQSGFEFVDFAIFPAELEEAGFEFAFAFVDEGDVAQ